MESRDVIFNETSTGSEGDCNLDTLQKLIYPEPEQFMEEDEEWPLLPTTGGENSEAVKQQQQQQPRRGRPPGTRTEVMKERRQTETVEHGEPLPIRSTRERKSPNRYTETTAGEKSNDAAPGSYTEAMDSPEAEEWDRSMNEEMMALAAHNV